MKHWLNRTKTDTNPEENPGLPLDFNNLDEKPKVEDFCEFCE